MTKIAGTYNRRCVARALSTMRLALGIDGDMPDVPADVIDCSIPDFLPSAFPAKAIRVWHSDSGHFNGLRSTAWSYQGSRYESSPEVDDWLTAFCYSHPEAQVGHCVIGEPAPYVPGAEISLIFSVKIEQKG